MKANEILDWIVRESIQGEFSVSMTNVRPNVIMNGVKKTASYYWSRKATIQLTRNGEVIGRSLHASRNHSDFAASIWR